MLLGVPKNMNVFVGIDQIVRICDVEIVQIVCLEDRLQLAISVGFCLTVEIPINLQDG
jgi:hypothetical protein